MNGNLIIIGNGMASNRILEALGTEHPFNAIHVFSDERCNHYNRIMLSPLLAQETTLAAITPHNSDWYTERRIQIHLGQPVTRVDTEHQCVRTTSGRTFDYTRLVFATGSRSAIPPLSGTDANNVMGFRAMADVDRMLDSIADIRHATVIGAGLLGVEAAVGLKAQGIDVTLMHRNPVLMNRQLDAIGSGLLEEELGGRGIDVRTGVNPESLIKNDNDVVTATTFGSRTATDAPPQTLETQLVVFATGILPNTELASSAGVNVDRGICVNANMQTSANNVFALGECCQYEQHTYGLVAPIWDQATVVAQQLLDGHSKVEPYREREHLTKLKVSGIDIHSIGQFNARTDADPVTGLLDEVITLEDLSAGVYKKLVVNNQRIRGVLCIGDVLDSGWFYQLMCDETDILPMRDLMILGKRWVQIDQVA